MSLKEITANTLKEFLSNEMSGMNPSSCRTKWKIIHEFRDMYLNGERNYVTLCFDPLGFCNKRLITLWNAQNDCDENI